MRMLYIILFLLLWISNPLEIDASVKKIGKVALEIGLPKDYDISKGYKYQCPLKNMSDKDQEVYYELSGFKTKENSPVTVKLYDKENQKPKLYYSGAPVTTTEFSTFAKGEEKLITLKFTFDRESDEYSGTLTIHSFSKEDPASNTKEDVTFTFKKYIEPRKTVPKSNLEINHGSEEPVNIRTVIEPSGSSKKYNINLENKSKEAPIENVIIRPSSLVKEVGDDKTSVSFDPQKYKENLSKIERNKSEVVPLPLPKISRPGTYNIGFTIEAEGMEPQQVKVIVQARYGVLAAVLVLLAGSALSYFVTRVIIIIRTKYNRTSVIKRIKREVEDYTDDNQYLKERIRALASISTDLNKGWIFISKDKTRDFLELADYLLEVGKRKANTWNKLQDIAAPYGLVEGAAQHLKKVDRLVEKYDVMAKKTEIDSLLNKAEEYTKEDKGPGYWLELKQKIEKLLTEEVEAEGAVNDYIKELKKELEEFKEKAEVEYNKLKTVDDTYKKLELVYRYKDLKDINKAIETAGKNRDKELDALFSFIWKEENITTWERIQQNWKQGKVEIIPPSYVIEDEVGVFTVDFGEESLNNSYLARKGLTYDWEFRLSSKKNPAKDIPPSRGMKSNSVAKYFPVPGVYDIILKIAYKDKTIDETLKMEGITVRPNEDIKRIKQISKVEFGLYIAASILAVLSGLQSQYAAKPDFGSLNDFVALFLWAVAFDQGKNLIGWMKGIKEAQPAPSQPG